MYVPLSVSCSWAVSGLPRALRRRGLGAKRPVDRGGNGRASLHEAKSLDPKSPKLQILERTCNPELEALNPDPPKPLLWPRAGSSGMRIRDGLAPCEGRRVFVFLLDFRFRACVPSRSGGCSSGPGLKMLKSKFEQDAVCSSGFEPVSCDFGACLCREGARLQLRPHLKDQRRCRAQLSQQ